MQKQQAPILSDLHKRRLVVYLSTKEAALATHKAISEGIRTPSLWLAALARRELAKTP